MLPFEERGEGGCTEAQAGEPDGVERVEQERFAPPGMPVAPDEVYRGNGWVSWPDWLGNGGTPPNSMLPFKEARVAARKLKLGSWKEWSEWSKSGLRPPGMPSSPDRTYRGDGWVSFPDWLGNGGK